MSTTAPDSDDRFPTTGPDEAVYERYRFVTTADEEAIIYDAEASEAWIQADSAVVLEEWR